MGRHVHKTSTELAGPAFRATYRLPVFLCLSLSADSLQAQLINMGVIPTLVKLLGVHSHNTPLTEMCLIAFGNLAELGEYLLAEPTGVVCDSVECF